MTDNLVEMPGNTKQEAQELAMPLFLQREETAAQIVAFTQAKFPRPGPEEIKEIVKCAEQQITQL